jgi:hypothetical protein
MKILGKSLATACLVVALPSYAVVMDFNNLPTNPGGLVDAGTSITQYGYTVTSTTTPYVNYWEHNFQGAADGWQNFRGTSNGTTTVAMSSLNSNTPITFSLTSATSQPFNFLSIDIGAWNANNGQFYNSDSTQWTFIGNLASSGTVSYSVNTNHNAFGTYLLPSTFNNLLSVNVKASIPVPGISISNGAGMSANFDNIVVTSVPEAETYAMMLAGLGLIGATVTRRKAKQA